MIRPTVLTLLALVAVAGCSKPASGDSAKAGASIAAAAPIGTACDRKLVTSADAAAILGEPVSDVKTLPGDAQSCVFSTASLSTLTIGVRPGQGRTTLAAWKAGKMNLDATPLTGIGDEAVWQPMLKEVNATKNNELCDISVMGAPGSGAATPETLGALCNRIFAAG